jgi:hypothetical protein
MSTHKSRFVWSLTTPLCYWREKAKGLPLMMRTAGVGEENPYTVLRCVTAIEKDSNES